MTVITSPARSIELAGLGMVNNPFVAWDNLAASATASGTAVLTGGDRANALTGTTYDKWRPDVTTSTATLSFDFGSAKSIGFAAIAAHNLHDFDGSVILQSSPDNTTWTSAVPAAHSPDDGSTIAFRVSGISARYWRFLFADLTSGDLLSVGVAFMGSELIFPRRFYQGFSPVLTPTEVQLQSNVSQGGHLLGSSVVGTGSTLSATINNLDASFIRGAAWLDFQAQFNQGKGFFFGWRPEKYPQDLHYCWRDGGVIRPTNSGPRDLMSVEMAMRAYNG